MICDDQGFGTVRTMMKKSVYERMASSPLLATVHFSVPIGTGHAHCADFYHEDGMVVRLDGHQIWSVVREPKGPRESHPLVQRDGARITGVFAQIKVPAGHLPDRIALPIEVAHTEHFAAA